MLGDSGENLPSVLEAICTDSTRERNLMSWLQELTPMDVKDFDFPRDPSGRIHLHIVERNGRKVSAYSASDGTLRFLGILAALLDPNEGGLYFFEEIDNGIHPNRLWLLLDLIEQQTAKGKIQVVTTTHSPALLAWMNDTTFEHTSVVYRDEYWTDSVIRPIAGLYNLRELRKSQGLGRLHTGGWMEDMLAFAEADRREAREAGQ
jgi:predicted ATPase